MDRPRSPPAHSSPSPPRYYPHEYQQHQHHHQHLHQHPHQQHLPHPPLHHHSEHAAAAAAAYQQHHQSRPSSRVSDSRLPAGDQGTPPGSPPHKRLKSDTANVNANTAGGGQTTNCPVDQRWHYSHAPYPTSFYPYPYHHQTMPHRVQDMSLDRPLSHRSDGPAQYQFMPHSQPTPPPIATLHHSPALSASSLDSNSISPSPPITQPSTPYYSHPAQPPPMSQAPPYPYQPNGSMQRYDDPQAPYSVPPPQNISSRSIRPTIVSAQPYPGQPNYVIHTDDASTKLSDRVRRKCYNCRTTDTSTWRRSSLTPGKVLCNKCGLFERTHSRPRPEQFPHKRGPVVNVNQFKQHRSTPPSPSHVAQAAAHAAMAHHHHQQQQQQQEQQQGGRRLPPMSADMLPPHHYSHPSLSPLMAARSSDAQQYNRSGGVTEIGALLNSHSHSGEGSQSQSQSQASGGSAGASPRASPQQQQQHEHGHEHGQPHGIKRSGSPLEQPQHAQQASSDAQGQGQTQVQAQGSPAVSAGSIPGSPRNERREPGSGSGSGSGYRASK